MEECKISGGDKKTSATSTASSSESNGDVTRTSTNTSAKRPDAKRLCLTPAGWFHCCHSVFFFNSSYLLGAIVLLGCLVWGYLWCVKVNQWAVSVCQHLENNRNVVRHCWCSRKGSLDLAFDPQWPIISYGFFSFQNWNNFLKSKEKNNKKNRWNRQPLGSIHLWLQSHGGLDRINRSW